VAPATRVPVTPSRTPAARHAPRVAAENADRAEMALPSVWWAVAAPGTYGRSHDGCVTASVPSTTGGGLVHACGDKAKSLCRASFTRTDKLSKALRPQCRAAGLGPAAGSAPAGSGAG